MQQNAIFIFGCLTKNNLFFSFSLVFLILVCRDEFVEHAMKSQFMFNMLSD
jgi:hypothetical protein